MSVFFIYIFGRKTNRGINVPYIHPHWVGGGRCLMGPLIMKEAF